MRTFETSDLYLSSALKTIGFKLLDIKKVGTKGIFVFEDRPDREEAVKKYFSGELSGSFKAFANTWSDLKGYVMELR